VKIGHYYKFTAPPPINCYWPLLYCKPIREQLNYWEVVGNDRTVCRLMKNGVYLIQWKEIPKVLGMIKVGE